MTLVVTDAGGRAGEGPAADGRGAVGRVAARRPCPSTCAPGRYTYELRLGDGAWRLRAEPVRDAAAGSSASAALVVLAPLPPGFPGKKAVAAAREWIAGRDGDVAFAVVDTNGEDAGGYREHEPFQLASLSKAIMLVASLRDDPTPDAATEATLTRMITESDNGAAYTIFGRVGAKGMRAVAKAAGMQDYEQGSGWVDTRASAWDQARFFSQLESLVPAAGREPRAAAALGRHPHPALGHPRGGRARGLDQLLQGRLAGHGQQAHGPGRLAGEGQEARGRSR